MHEHHAKSRSKQPATCDEGVHCAFVHVAWQHNNGRLATMLLPPHLYAGKHSGQHTRSAAIHKKVRDAGIEGSRSQLLRTDLWSRRAEDGEARRVVVRVIMRCESAWDCGRWVPTTGIP